MEKDEKKEVLENPENWEDMVKKYQEREEEQLKKILERKKVESVDQLIAFAKKAIVTRAGRVSGEHQTLKNRVILREAKSEEINSLREQLSEEISTLAKELIKHFPSLKKPSDALKGRVTLGAPEEKIPVESSHKGS
jgi:hypothetical protein